MAPLLIVALLVLGGAKLWRNAGSVSLAVVNDANVDLAALTVRAVSASGDLVDVATFAQVPPEGGVRCRHRPGGAETRLVLEWMEGDEPRSLVLGAMAGERIVLRTRGAADAVVTRTPALLKRAEGMFSAL